MKKTKIFTINPRHATAIIQQQTGDDLIEGLISAVIIVYYQI